MNIKLARTTETPPTKVFPVPITVSPPRYVSVVRITSHGKSNAKVDARKNDELTKSGFVIWDEVLAKDRLTQRLAILSDAALYLVPVEATTEKALTLGEERHVPDLDIDAIATALLLESGDPAVRHYGCLGGHTSQLQ